MSLCAGLSTGIGGLLVLLIKNKTEKILSFSLGFSSGVMMLVSLGDLIPEASHMLKQSLSPKLTGLILALSFLVGAIIATLIERAVPENEGNDLGRVGIVSMLAMVLHNLPEGMATFLSGYKDISLGLSITLAVAMHNIPEGICISVPMYYSGHSKKKSIGMSFISGISEPIGAVLSAFILGPFLNDTFLGILFAIIAGIMVYISFNELLPASSNHGNSNYSLLGVLLGIFIMSIAIL